MGYNVKKIREEAGFTQAQLAARSGVSRVTIAMLESKNDYTTTTRTLQKIASALDTPVEKLFLAPAVKSAEHNTTVEV